MTFAELPTPASASHTHPMLKLVTKYQGCQPGLRERQPQHSLLRMVQPRLGIVRPLTTAGRATNASNTRVTLGKSFIPTNSPAS
jgi:hypothetical protein